MPSDISIGHILSCVLRGIKEFCMDWKVDIYIKTDTRYLGKRKRWISYVIATTVKKELKTIEHFEAVEETLQGAQLIAIDAALKRMTKPAKIVIHVESSFIANMFTMHLAEWAAGGWINPMRNNKEWRYLEAQTHRHEITIDTEPHVYSAWQLLMMKKQAEMAQDRVNTESGGILDV